MEKLHTPDNLSEYHHNECTSGRFARLAHKKVGETQENVNETRRLLGVRTTRA